MMRSSLLSVVATLVSLHGVTQGLERRGPHRVVHRAANERRQWWPTATSNTAASSGEPSGPITLSVVARTLRGGSTAAMSAANVSEEAMAILSVVPVFALTDDRGRPVLVQGPDDNETARPQQLWFTDVNVARAHAGHIMKISGDEKLQIKLAMSNLEQVRATVLGRRAMPTPPDNREVRVCADPREVHVARQLLLRAAGFYNSKAVDPPPPPGAPTLDFSNETVVAAEASRLQGIIGVDFDTDVPLFTLPALNATVEGSKVVQPWFLSFADLVRAYVNSTVPADADDEQYKTLAQAALSKMLEVGETAVTTLDKLLRAMQNGNDNVFIMPPASSVDAISRARLASQDGKGSSSSKAASSAAGTASSAAAPSAASLFDDPDSKHSDLFGD